MVVSKGKALGIGWLDSEFITALVIFMKILCLKKSNCGGKSSLISPLSRISVYFYALNVAFLLIIVVLPSGASGCYKAAVVLVPSWS